MYPYGNQSYKETDLEIRVIRHNQYLACRNKFPYFDINPLSLSPYYHTLYIFKVGEVVLCTPLYMHVLIFGNVSDRNGERKVQTEDGGFYGVTPDNLL